MQRIELFERAIAEKAKCLADYGINPAMFWAYRSSKKAGNDLIDFNEVIWDEDIEAIAQGMRDNGIAEFTISSTFSSLIATLAKFDKLGIKVVGITEVNADYKDFTTGEIARIPAVRMSL